MSTKIDTRKIIKEPGSNQAKDVYYIPGYLRIKCKNFTAMDLENLNAGMNTTIIFTVYYGCLPESLVEELERKIVFLFGRDDAKELTSEDELEVTVKNKKEEREIQFTIRQVFQLRIETDVFFTPFEVINLILSITVQPVESDSYGTVKINLMDYPERILKASYSEEGTFGTYDLCERKMAAEYSNDRFCKVEKFYEDSQVKRQNFEKKKMAKLKSEKDKIEQFQYGHFLIPLYKYPSIAVATIFLPLWLLAIINLAIFFQNTSMADRVGSISGIMIAFVALIPTIRQNIPPNPKIVFIQILVYSQSLTSLFVLIESVMVRNLGDDYDFIWYESGFFMVSLIITILSFIIIVFLIIMHYCVWESSYKMKLNQEKDVSFKRQDWSNELCDMYFSRIAELRGNGKYRIEQLLDPVLEKKSKKND